MINLRFIGRSGRVLTIFATVGSAILFSGCETTESGTTEITGQRRKAVSEWDVDIYQDPVGLLPWVADMDIPAKYEQIAKLEAADTVGFNNRTAVDDKTTQMVFDLKKRAARLGANAIVVREVNIAEDVVERQSSGYETVRYPDGSIGQIDVPVVSSYERVFKITIVADSVFLDWNTVWTGGAGATN